MNFTSSSRLPRDRVTQAIRFCWPALSDSDVDWVQQRSDRLLFLIVRTYGYSRDEARRQINLFFHLSAATDDRP